MSSKVADDELTFRGTIYTPAQNGGLVATNKPNDFYRLPLRQRNQIEVNVKASSDATLLLQNKSAVDGKSYKVKIVIGAYKNTTISVGLATEDGTYPTLEKAADGVLNANEFKAFTVRWYDGRINVYHTGFTKPLITWNGPKDLLITDMGCRTTGCSGEWRVQGMAVFKTPDSNEYNEFEINTGRLDFEVRSLQDAYVTFLPTTEYKAPSIHALFGIGAGSKVTGPWRNFAGINISSGVLPKNVLSTREFRKFWVEWDTTNFYMGHGNSENPGDPVSQINNISPPLQPIKYFALNTASGYDGQWHILQKVEPDDVVPSGGGSEYNAPQQQEQADSKTQQQQGGMGYVTFTTYEQY